MCWIDIYLRPPDLIIHNASKNFINKEFKQYISTIGINIKGVPIEAYNSIGIIKQYYRPL